MDQKLLIFDFDGTIADSAEMILETINQLSDTYGYAKIKESDVEGLRGKTIKELFRILKIPWMKLPFLLIEYRKKYTPEIPRLKTAKGIDVVLRRLHRDGEKLVIVTSNSKENVKKFLKKNNIDIFDQIQGGISLFGKSHILAKLTKDNKHTKEFIFYIGDEVRDIQAAKKVEVKVIAVTWGFQSKKILAEYEPDYIVDTPEKLYTVLQKY